MTMKGIKWITIAAIILMIATPAFGAISKEDASKSVSSYVLSGETSEIYGPYTYENHAYYYAEISTDKSITGILIVDAESGKIIEDLEIAKKIIYTKTYLADATPENLAAYNATRDGFNNASVAYREKSEAYKKEIPLYKAEERAKFETIVQSYQEAATLYDGLSDIMKRAAETQADIIKGNASYENAVKFSNQMTEYENSLKKMGTIYDKIMGETNAYYGVLINGAATYKLNATEMSDYKLLSETAIKQEKDRMITQVITLIQEDNANTEERVNSEMEVMEVRLKTRNSIPGFGILAAVGMVLVAGFLIRRKEK